MNATQSLLEAAMKAQGLTNPNQLATRISASRQAVYYWRDGVRQADEKYAIKLAKLAGLDPAPYIAQMQAEKATSDEARQFWHMTAARLAA